MALANEAYYAAHDPFRDFTTAPEIAQMFGELLGAWAAIAWMQLEQPAPVHLVEAGPGRGTLMQDLLRTVSRVAPAFAAACRVHFIETSHRLRAEQRSRVPAAIWHTSLQDLPPGPMILLANEFLDALPIRQFERLPTDWAERYVQHGAFVLQETTPPIVMPTVGHGKHDVVEYGEAARAWVAALSPRISQQGGIALILDYGPTRSAPGDSLQALKDGRPANPLEAPGEADLTAHVDFQALAETAQAGGAAAWGPLPQGAFLHRLGLRQRTAALAAANPARAAALQEAAFRLAAPQRMGALFKALAITQFGRPPPPGFE